MGQVVAAVASASPCGHRAIEAQQSLRQQQREARIQANKAVFSSDEDDNGIWKAWGANGELRLENGKPFSSGTEAEQDGRDFETAMRRWLASGEKHLELRDMSPDSVKALQKARKRLPRDLASLECSRALPNEPEGRHMRSQVDGAGTIKWQILERCDWIVRPSSIDGDRTHNVTGPFCVAEMSINAKPFALKIYQLGKIASMLSQGAKFRGETTEVNKLFYIVITNRGKPILQADKLLRRYSALSQAHNDGRFGVMHVSWGFFAESFELGGSAQPQTKPVWVRQLRKEEDGKIKEADTAPFKIKESVADVDDLKEAIKQKEELSIAASKLEVHSFKDGRWEKENVMSKSLRDTDESDCYGYLLPS